MFVLCTVTRESGGECARATVAAALDSRQQPRRALLSPQISLYATRERFKIQAADAQENNNPRPSRRVASSRAASYSRVVFLFMHLP